MTIYTIKRNKQSTPIRIAAKSLEDAVFLAKYLGRINDKFFVHQSFTFIEQTGVIINHVLAHAYDIDALKRQEKIKKILEI